MVEESGVKVKLVKRDGQKTFFSLCGFVFVFLQDTKFLHCYFQGFFQFCFFFYGQG